MKILIEGYHYRAVDVAGILKGMDFMENVTGEVVVNYVGYLYNPQIQDCVFILPKVLVDKDGKAFSRLNPAEIIELEKSKTINDEERAFIYEFAVWIYRTLCVYKQLNKDSDIVYYKQMAELGNHHRHITNTYLEVLLALVQFNRKNQDFFMTVLKNIHSGFNKTNWTRTISRSPAIIQDNSPIYIKPVNKKRLINFDEELLVIFFSILQFISDKYGFPVKISIGFELIKGAKFEHYLNGYGRVRLRQIKYKYFSDKALYLWELCNAFFERAQNISVASDLKEYLIAKNFNIVFESIIDELIGDKASELPRFLKDQKDGKRVDHLYRHDALTSIGGDEMNPRKIFYIGDSKYYNLGSPITDESVFKQYTYARNLIQWSIDLFNPDHEESEWRKRVKEQRDNVTEGYGIVPNFFISAKMDEGLSYDDKICPTDRKDKYFMQKHFEDRLFDRDTLLIYHYDVNFLYVISLYARNNDGEKQAWKQKVRDMFRREIRQILQEKFDFYAMKSIGNPLAGEQFIKEHFKELQGKLYRPYGDKNLFALALERHEGAETSESDTYRLLRSFFEIMQVKLGDAPQKHLEERVEAYQQEHPYSNIPEDWLPEYHIERYVNYHFVIGMYHDQEHWDWITGKHDRGSLIYNVRLDKNRGGAQNKKRLESIKPKFAILYEEGHESENRFHAFRIHATARMTQAQMEQAQYPTNHGGPKGDYFIFHFDEEVRFAPLDINRLISKHRISDKDFVEGTPLFPSGGELLEYKL